MFLAGTSGFLTTILGIALVFFPAQQITSLWSYEDLDGGRYPYSLSDWPRFFFFVYGRLKEPPGATVWLR